MVVPFLIVGFILTSMLMVCHERKSVKKVLIRDRKNGFFEKEKTTAEYTLAG